MKTILANAHAPALSKSLGLTIYILPQQQQPLFNMDLRRRHRHRDHHHHRFLPNKLDNYHTGNHHDKLPHVQHPTTMPALHDNGVLADNDVRAGNDVLIDLHTLLSSNVLNHYVHNHTSVRDYTGLHTGDGLLYCGRRMQQPRNNYQGWRPAV